MSCFLLYYLFSFYVFCRRGCSVLDYVEFKVGRDLGSFGFFVCLVRVSRFWVVARKFGCFLLVFFSYVFYVIV